MTNLFIQLKFHLFWNLKNKLNQAYLLKSAIFHIDPEQT